MSDFIGQEAGCAWLEDHSGARFELTPSFKIGRSSECHLRVPGIQASREHALVSFDSTGDSWWFTDLDSTNGSYLNDRRIRIGTRLRSGDRIRIGKGSWVFRRGAEAPEIGDSLTGRGATVIDMSAGVCWLLIGDVVGSTRLARELGAEEMSRRFKTWTTECEQVVESNSGYINEFTGDGFLAIWHDQKDNSESLIRALEEFRVFRGSSAVPFRIVLHWGEVLIGGGGPTSGRERIAGEEVHFVFKAERAASRAKSNEFFISGPASERLSESVALQHLGDFPVPGFNEHRAFYTMQ